ncbi:benzodiazapine receptor [Klebsormidium nitens]|uniref:Benzodiazapine receptor n=1 Tax=Klebsormidium nitens TaxID=105231 RepID=A0A1Y1HTP0_KLENI|nr:benzodiazapine receptor [Klebsormidium nitens]|eukprot:GAQ79208.1 benzodiazapine receptor [Klebsormidium nitens]
MQLGKGARPGGATISAGSLPQLDKALGDHPIMAVWTEYLALAVAIAIPVGGGFLGSLFNGSPDDWYKHLDKPSWTPPGWVFPVMWTTLYLLMGIASWLVYKKGGFQAQSLPLGVYALQLLLNFSWTPLFFGLHRMDIAFAEIIALWLSIAATIYLFHSVDPTAGYLLTPYIAWVTVAAALNWTIWSMNPGMNGVATSDPAFRGFVSSS